MRRFTSLGSLKHLAAAGLVAAAAGCSTGPSPSPAFSTYFLTHVDGKPLPTTHPWLGDGYQLVMASLQFTPALRPREPADRTNLVTLVETVRWPDGHLEESTVHYPFVATGNQVVITLCPPGALCAAIRNELVGTVAENGELLLDHYLGGQRKESYRYLAALTD